MALTLWHNPRCSKSRQTLKLLRDRGVEPRVVEYLKEPPDAALLKRLLRQLGLSARDLLRRGEAAYKELGLADLGFLFHCNRDFAMVEGLSPGLALKRTQTIMQGASHCDFRFATKPRP